VAVHKAPRISIVTPSLNQGQFLETCITSVLRQEYPNLEYLIIDGGSTDGSARIIEKHRAQLAYWVSEPDLGQSDAINKGLRRATGEVVAWLNADDFYLPEALNRVADVYQGQPEASFYFGDGLRVDETGKPLGGFFPDGRVVFHPAALIYGLNYILQPAAFINRKHLVQANYLDSGLKYGMDTDLWIRLAQLAPPMPIRTCLAASREYGTTKTASGSFARAEELRRIAEQHSGVPLTPGALSYYLHTLYQLIGKRPDIFPAPFAADVETFWKVVQRLLFGFGARVDGFPLTTVDEIEMNPPANPPVASEADRTARLLQIDGLNAELRTARAELRALNRQLVRRRFKPLLRSMRRWVQKGTGSLG
jgi:Glycosyl transferase family 2